MYKLIGILILTGLCAAEDEIFCKDNNPCSCQTDKGLINLWSLGNTDLTFRFNETETCMEDTFNILYNPCYTATAKQYPDLKGEECADVAACLQNTNLTGDSTGQKAPYQMRMALQGETKFVGTKGYDFTINYDGPDTGRKRSLKVDLICEKKSIKPQLAIKSITCNFSDTEMPIQVTLTLTSVCACLDGCPMSAPSHHKKGLSTGSILLILFFFAVLLYVLGGVLYNRIVGGASGIELIPNVEFWTVFPLLVIDGVKFTCNCCRTKRLGAEYDNM